jgi:adenine-specific DNA-methyltransferase
MNKKLEIEKLKAEVERLKMELKKRKKYGLVWEDKPEEVVEMCKEKLPVLKEVKNKEIITDKEKPVNLLIEGDNYRALSVLNYTHAGKVDVIYIDPPYNTGNKDFIFNDRYVDREDAYRHSKWLSFMEKRLKLAKNLLKDTGVIFISIDDNEVAQLKLLMDQIFNYISILNIQMRNPERQLNLKADFQKSMEYLLVYSKTKTYKIKKNEISYDFSDYKYKIREKAKGEEMMIGNRKVIKFLPTEYEIISCDNNNDPNILKSISIRGRIKNAQFTGIFYERYLRHRLKKDGRDTLYKVFNMGDDGLGYRYIKQPSQKTINGVYFQGVPLDVRKNMNNSVRLQPYPDFFDYSEDNIHSGILLRDMFGKKPFDTLKPIELIKWLINISSNKDSVILDFFAGSGTTGQAVLELNKEDGGNRQFILCTNNENNICTDVCYPRIKKVIGGYKNLKGEQVEGLGGNLKYFRTDFVDAEPSDKNKIKLTHQATEMLCIKEGTFEKVIDNERFKIFKNSDHYTGIILDQTAIPEFKEAIKNMSGKFSVYVFSLGDETFDDEFDDIKQKVNLSPIPEAILRVYRRIFK